MTKLSTRSGLVVGSFLLPLSWFPTIETNVAVTGVLRTGSSKVSHLIFGV